MMKSKTNSCADYHFLIPQVHTTPINTWGEMARSIPYCLEPGVTRESIRADSRALPPGKTAADKYYLGYFQGDKLAAVLDLILDYPRAQTAFVGFFMLARRLQGRGVGSAIVAEALQALARQGYTHVRLGYVKGNPQSEAFWLKNGFRPTGIETRPASYTVVVLERPTAQPE